MELGQIVEFIEGRQFITAFILKDKGGKLQVLSETDREMNVSTSRVMHVSKSGVSFEHPRNETVKLLREVSKRRAEMSSVINLSDLWELLEGEGELFDYKFLAELVWPAPIGPDHLAATIRAIFEDGLYFKMRPDQAERHTAEKMAQIVEARAMEEAREKELSEGADWLGRVWEDEPFDEPDCRGRVVSIMRDMALFGPEAHDFKWGQRLLERAALAQNPWVPFQLLVKLNEMGLHENLELLRHDIPTLFSVDALLEAQRLATEKAWESESRRDLTNLNVITADSGGAKDFDDAVSLELLDDRILLGVHIADVSSVIKPGTILDEEARQRVTSIYMPDMRIPMLPEILSEECLSLKEGVPRPAFSLLVELSPAGEVLDYQWVKSLVKVKRQLSYQEVDGTVETDLVLRRMFELSRRLKARRIEQGALILPLPKLNVYLTSDGEIGVNITYWENPGRSMISEFMILANYLAARYLNEKGVPCLFRKQAEPGKRLIGGDHKCEDFYTCLMQRKYLPRVQWSVEAGAHATMGLDMYTNLTSPLRRYIDLLIQRQVSSLLDGLPPIYSEEQLSQTLAALVETQRKVNMVQNTRRRYWLFRYFEGVGRKDYQAMVLERNHNRWRIFLNELMVDADLPYRPEQHLEPGDVIKVRIKQVLPREDILRFEIV